MELNGQGSIDHERGWDMEKNMLEVLKKMKILKELYCVDEPTYPYIHTTFKVEKLSEFIDIISGFGEKLKKNKIYKILYRGMSNEIWEPISSLARNRKFEVNENEIIHEFKYRCPEEFFNANSNFEMLANMQHYGLPTRLLDFTENPLVALYFSCKESKRNNGRVLCFFSFESLFMQQYAQILCDIACNGMENNAIDLYIRKYGISSFDFVNEMYLGNPYFVIRPPYWNERQKRQGSVFLVFSNLLIDAYGQAIYYGIDFNIKKEVRESIEKHEDLIKIYQNSLWRPDEYFVNNYPQKKPLSFVTNKESWRLLRQCYEHSAMDSLIENCINRFRIVSQLETISMDDLDDYFCSIIIPAKYKKNILYELSLIGINESFVYPEKEYIANDIKHDIK